MQIPIRRIELAESDIAPIRADRLESYVRLTNWIFRFPQILRDYQEQHFAEGNGNWVHFAIVTWVIAVNITLLFAIVVYAVGIFLSVIESRTIVVDVANGVGWATLAIAAYYALSYIRSKPVEFAIAAPSIGAVSVSAYSTFFLHLHPQVPKFSLTLFLLHLLLGLSLGLLYSVIRAYASDVIPSLMRIVVYGLVCCLLSAYVFLFSRRQFAWSINDAYLALLYWIIAFLGFYFAALRADDYLFPYRRNAKYGIGLNSGDLRLPRVTPIQLRYVETLLNKWLEDDWHIAVANMQQLWRYTLQRKYIPEVLIRYLLTLQDNERLQIIRHWAELDRGRIARHMMVRSGSSYGQIRDALTLKNMRPITGIPELEFLRSPESVEDLDRQLLGLLAIYSAYKNEPAFDAELLPEIVELIPDPPREFRELARLITTIQHLEDIELVLAINQNDIPSTSGLPWKEKPRECNTIKEFSVLMQYALLYVHCSMQSEAREKIRNIMLPWLDRLKDGLKCPAAVGTQASNSNVEGAGSSIDQSLDAEAQRLCGIISKWTKQLLEEPINQSIGYEPITEVKNPYSYDRPLGKASTFVGRRRQIANIRRAWDPKNLSTVEIVGPVLMGKSSVIEAVKDFEPRLDFATVSLQHLNTNHVPDTQVIFAVYDQLRGLLRNDIHTRRELAREPYRVMEQLIREICQSPAEREWGLVLVFDDLDYLDTRIDIPSFVHLLGSFYHLSESLPRFGLTIIRNVVDNDLFSQYKVAISRNTRQIYVEPLSVSDDYRHGPLVDLLSGYVHGLKYMFHSTAIEMVQTETGGIPYLVQLLAWNVLEYYVRAFNGELEPDERNRNTDPLFMPRDIQTVLKRRMLQDDFEYYISRLLACFRDDIDIATGILKLFATSENANGMQNFQSISTYLEQNSIAATEEEIEIVLGALCEHFVLRQAGDDQDGNENTRYCRRFEMLRLYGSNENE